MTALTITNILLLISALAGAGCSLALALQLRRLKRDYARSQREVPQEAAAEKEQKSAQQQVADFDGSLLEATLKQRLQKGPTWRQTPEKYRYAAALAEQGMDAERIATILQFPIEEAEQLLALNRVARPQQKQVGDGRE